jgi:hypothetical protein
MNEDELWEEFSNSLIRDSAAPMTMNYDDSESIRKNGIRECVNRWRYRIDKAPTIDAVPVVRCKNCKHWEPTDGIVGICKEQVIMHEYDSGVFHLYPEHEDNYYCAYGEEKDE